MELNFKRLKPIPKFAGYFAGADGYIYSYWAQGNRSRIDYSRKARRLKARLTGGNYLGVTLKQGNRYISKDVHRLICLSWHGKSKKTASHKDGNKLNNRSDNLCWESYSENLKRRLAHGTDDRGYHNSRAKITKGQLVKINKLLKEGYLTHREIGLKFGVSRVFITKINCGLRYKMWSTNV